MRKYVPVKFILTLAALAAFTFLLGPVILRGAGKLVDLLNPGKALVTRLRGDLAAARAANRDMQVEYDSLSQSLRQAETLNTVKEQELRRALDRVNGLLRSRGELAGVIDSLQGEIVAIRSGSGEVTVADSGRIVENSYEDDWIRIDLRRALGAPHYDSLAYSFGFSVADVSVTLSDSAGNRRTVYSVWIQSLRNPAARKLLGDYRVTETVLKDEMRLWRWWDPRLVWMSQIVGGAQMGLGLAVMSWSPALGAEGGTLLRLPILGLVSDLRGAHHAVVGVGVNAGYVLPLVQNLYLTGGYAVRLFGAGNRILFGVAVIL